MLPEDTAGTPSEGRSRVSSLELMSDATESLCMGHADQDLDADLPPARRLRGRTLSTGSLTLTQVAEDLDSPPASRSRRRSLTWSGSIEALPAAQEDLDSPLANRRRKRIPSWGSTESLPATQEDLDLPLANRRTNRIPSWASTESLPATQEDLDLPPANRHTKRIPSWASTESLPATQAPDDSLQHLVSVQSLASLTDLQEKEGDELRGVPTNQAFRMLCSPCSSPAAAAAPWHEVTSHIHDFWSYSRWGRSLDQAFTLLLHYGGVQGVIAGTIAAAATALLLPAQWASHHQMYAMVSMLAGVCACACACLATALLSSERLVFIDSACITQDDDAAMRAEILRLGYSVQNSKCMLCLWDTSYFSRAWCVYEIGTWLQSKASGMETPQLKLLSAPRTMLALAGFVASAAACLLGGLAEQTLPGALVSWSSTLRSLTYFGVAVDLAVACGGYAKEAVEQRRQLAAFSLAGVRCFCCDHGHVHPETKEVLECDYQLIETTFVRWFGSIRAFEAAFHSEIPRVHQSTRRRAFVQATTAVALPCLWHLLGSWAWAPKSGNEAQELPLFDVARLTVLLAGPMIAAC